MTGIIDRLSVLLEEHQEDLPFLKHNAANLELDRDGASSDLLGGTLRFLGVSAWVLNKDAHVFKSNLSEAASIRNSLFLRFENGDSVDGSFVTMLSHKSLFDALAAGDMSLAGSLASHMGGRDDLEKEHDHPFDYAMGYTLKAFVLNNPKEEKHPAVLRAACQESRMNDLLGYATMFDAILSRDTEAAHLGLQEVVSGHQRQSRGNGIFVDTEDEVLCVWGIGMANLARSHGLHVEGIAPRIPQDLLV